MRVPGTDLVKISAKKNAIILMVITEITENLTVNHKDSKNPLSSANALI